MKWTEYYKKVFDYRYWSNEPIDKKTVCFVKLVSENDKKEEEKMKLSDFIKKYGDCEVTEEMEKCIKKKKGKWMPENREVYWFIDYFGKVMWANWANYSCDNYRRDFMRIFKTEAEAEKYLEIMKACKEASFEPDWEDGNTKYYFVYSISAKEVKVMYRRSSTDNAPFYFATEEAARGLIDKFGEKDIAKYVLGVEFEG